MELCPNELPRAPDEMAPGPQPPRTVTVVLLLAAFALLLSWLGCYALTGALAASDVIGGFGEDDPRPRWVLIAAAALFGLFVLMAMVSGWTSRRQLRRIDSISDE